MSFTPSIKSVKILSSNQNATSTNPNHNHQNIQHPRKRILFNKVQVEVLEQKFQENQYISTRDRDLLAQKVNLTPHQVTIWFQNKRFSMKNKSQIKTILEGTSLPTLTSSNEALVDFVSGKAAVSGAKVELQTGSNDFISENCGTKNNNTNLEAHVEKLKKMLPNIPIANSVSISHLPISLLPNPSTISATATVQKSNSTSTTPSIDKANPFLANAINNNWLPPKNVARFLEAASTLPHFNLPSAQESVDNHHISTPTQSRTAATSVLNHQLASTKLELPSQKSHNHEDARIRNSSQNFDYSPVINVNVNMPHSNLSMNNSSNSNIGMTTKNESSAENKLESLARICETLKNSEKPENGDAELIDKKQEKKKKKIDLCDVSVQTDGMDDSKTEVLEKTNRNDDNFEDWVSSLSNNHLIKLNQCVHDNFKLRLLKQ